MYVLQTEEKFQFSGCFFPLLQNSNKPYYRQELASPTKFSLVFFSGSLKASWVSEFDLNLLTAHIMNSIMAL